MKSTLLRYGTAVTGFVLLLMIVMVLLLRGRDPNYDVLEIIGYIGIVLSVLFVFPAILHYRHHAGGGSISFGKAIGVGLAIVSIASFSFALFDTILIQLFDPGFYDKYYQAQVEKILASNGTDAQKQILAIREEREFFDSPLAQFFVMFVTVFVIGVIFTVISALILRRPGASRAG